MDIDDKPEKYVTFLIPVYGQSKDATACRAAVWKIAKSVCMYYQQAASQFRALVGRNSDIEEIVLNVFPSEFRWLDDERFNVHEAVPKFNDCGNPMRVGAELYDVQHPELDTDADRAVLTREGLAFRTARGSTTEHYETTAIPWDTFAALFATKKRAARSLMPR